MKKRKCPTCRFRSDSKLHDCNYLFITGHSRKAQPPEECTFYEPGEPVDATKQPVVIQKETRKREPSPARRYDWDLALQMWKDGACDREIGEAIGCKRATVNNWRHTMGLSCNPAVDRLPPKPSTQRKYDWDLGAEMYRAGACDSDIAAAIGCTPKHVTNWRARRGLPRNPKEK